MGPYDDVASEIELHSFVTKHDNQSREDENANQATKPDYSEVGLSTALLPADQVLCVTINPI